MLDANGNGVTDVVQGHFHRVQRSKKRTGKIARTSSGRRKSSSSPACPSTASCEFSTAPASEGRESTSARNGPIANISTAARPMAAIWTFYGITPERFPDGKLPLEMLLRVFRTYKGEIADEKKNNRTVGILGSLELRNPEQPSMKSTAIIFTVKDQVIDKHVTFRASSSAKPTGRIKTSRSVQGSGRRKDGRLEVGAAMPVAVAIYRRRRGRRLSQSEQRLVSAQFLQRLFRHLDADGAGDRLRRDVQHVSERPGGDAGHDRHADLWGSSPRTSPSCSRP